MQEFRPGFVHQGVLDDAFDRFAVARDALDGAGVFLAAFYLPKVKGGAAFWGALAGEAAVVGAWLLTDVSFLWLNALGCAVVVAVALGLSSFRPARDGASPESSPA